MNTPSSSTTKPPLTPVSTSIDVRDITAGERHGAVFAAFGALGPGDSLEIVDNQDPKPLYRGFQVEASGNFSWVYVQRGPAVWRVSIKKLSRRYGAGECCGVCGGKA